MNIVHIGSPFKNIGGVSKHIDIIIKHALNVNIKQTPVTYIHNEDTSVRILKDSIKMLSSLAKIKFKYR